MFAIPWTIPSLSPRFIASSVSSSISKSLYFSILSFIDHSSIPGTILHDMNSAANSSGKFGIFDFQSGNILFIKGSRENFLVVSVIAGCSDANKSCWVASEVLNLVKGFVTKTFTDSFPRFHSITSPTWACFQ